MRLFEELEFKASPEIFEDWARPKGFKLERKGERYADTATQVAWEGFEYGIIVGWYKSPINPRTSPTMRLIDFYRSRAHGDEREFKAPLEIFEDRARSKGFKLERNGERYADTATQVAWEGFEYGIIVGWYISPINPRTDPPELLSTPANT